MRAIVCTTLAEFRDLVQVIDAALGLPKDGVNGGPPPHVPVEQGRTLTWARESDCKHPTLNRWQVPHDSRLDVVRGAAARIMPNPVSQQKYDSALAKIDEVIDLPADWTPEVTL